MSSTHSTPCPQACPVAEQAIPALASAESIASLLTYLVGDPCLAAALSVIAELVGTATALLECHKGPQA